VSAKNPALSLVGSFDWGWEVIGFAFNAFFVGCRKIAFPFWVVLLPDDLVHVQESFEFGGICGGSFGACG
jgi:hypothetical protein